MGKCPTSDVSQLISLAIHSHRSWQSAALTSSYVSIAFIVLTDVKPNHQSSNVSVGLDCVKAS
jgi:hypothetical protein